MSARRRRSQQRSSRPPATRRRNNRRNARPSFGEALRGANRRAHQRANRRLAKRKKLTPIHASTIEDDGHLLSLTASQRAWRILAILVMLPCCYIATRALLSVGHSSYSYWLDLAKTTHFLYFMIGTMLMMGWFFTRLCQNYFLYLYVLGHELTHAIFVYICGGNVSKMHVATDGGYIMTNKSNFLIALSPYFIPFWSVVVLIVSFLLDLFLDIPFHEEILYGLIGATWTFHILWTLWMIPRDQPDLIENGVVFSGILIYLANVLLISVLLLVVPGSLTWHHWFNETLQAWQDLQKLPSQILGILR